MLIAPPITGTLPAGGTVALGLGNGVPPFTMQLNSTAAGRAIGVSADGGQNFVTLAPLATSAGVLFATINSPLSQVQFTGNAADKYEIL